MNLDGGPFWTVYYEVVEYVGHYLYDCRPWSKDNAISYERGVWVRCYGVHFQAWNNVFFVGLTSIHDRLLKFDDSTLDKERLDYARLLISTSILKELNVVEDLWIDARKFSICIIVDPEFDLADDVCMVEYEDDHNNSVGFEPVGMHDEEPLVETIMNQMYDDWKQEGIKVSIGGDGNNFSV